MSNNIKVSVIILNFNTPKLVKYLLNNYLSLDKQFSWEIIVINNGPHDLFIKEIGQYKNDVRLLSMPNKGYAAGNNLGIKSAQGEYILIMNPDLYWQSGEIEKMIAYLDDNQQVGMIGPKLIYANGDLQYSCLRYPDWHLPFYRRSVLGKSKAGQQWLKNYQMLEYNHQQPQAVDWLFGACLMVRKSAISQVGLLDENYFMYFEDLDWCRRFNQANWQVHYVPTAQVIHFHHRDSADRNGFSGLTTKLGRIHLHSWFKYIKKWNFS